MTRINLLCHHQPPAMLQQMDIRILRRNKVKYHLSCRLMFSNTKLERAMKRGPDTETDDIPSAKIKRSKSDPEDVLKCFLCEKEDNASSLHQAMTMQLNNRLNQCAMTLSDDHLLAKLSVGDVVAQEVKYHAGCLLSLYNRERAHLDAIQHEETLEGSHGMKVYPIAFSERLTYITEEEVMNNSGVPVVFRLADLAK